MKNQRKTPRPTNSSAPEWMANRFSNFPIQSGEQSDWRSRYEWEHGKLEELVVVSRQYHAVMLSTFVVTGLLLWVSWMVPFSEIRGTQYPWFHPACTLSFVWAVLGLVVWTLERKFQTGRTGWFLGLVLSADAVIAVTLRLWENI